jgi:hypothetical protein
MILINKLLVVIYFLALSQILWVPIYRYHWSPLFNKINQILWVPIYRYHWSRIFNKINQILWVPIYRYHWSRIFNKINIKSSRFLGGLFGSVFWKSRLYPSSPTHYRVGAISLKAHFANASAYATLDRGEPEEEGAMLSRVQAK